MKRAFVVIAAIGFAAVCGTEAAQAFTYDQHVYKGDASANFSNPDGSSSSSSSGFHVYMSGADSNQAAPGVSPFLQSSSPAVSSPVVPYYGGAGSMTPFAAGVR
jgi:hypothetical protein